MKPGPKPTPVAERFWQKVEKTDGCWLWTASLTPAGYGQIGVEQQRNGLAHRIAYELLVGPIPDGLTLDHLCRNRRCVNPAHLEPVTLAENVLRGDSPPALNASKTACKHGHAFTAENTYRYPNGRRGCRTCGRASDRARRHPKGATT